MTVTMLLVNTIEAAERAAATRRSSPATTGADRMTNPAARLRRPARFRPRSGPSTSRRRSTQLLADADAALRARRPAPAFPADYDALSAVLDVATERLQPRLGRGRPPQRGGRHARAARRLQRRTCRKVTEFCTRLGADERLYAKYKAIDTRRPLPRSSTARQALANAMRDFVLGGAELQGAAKARFAQIQERQAELAPEVLRARARRDRRLRATTRSADELDGVPDDASGRPRAPPPQAEGKRRLQAHAADARATCR